MVTENKVNNILKRHPMFKGYLRKINKANSLIKNIQDISSITDFYFCKGEFSMWGFGVELPKELSDRLNTYIESVNGNKDNWLDECFSRFIDFVYTRFDETLESLDIEKHFEMHDLSGFKSGCAFVDTDGQVSIFTSYQGYYGSTWKWVGAEEFYDGLEECIEENLRQCYDGSKAENLKLIKPDVDSYLEQFITGLTNLHAMYEYLFDLEHESLEPSWFEHVDCALSYDEDCLKVELERESAIDKKLLNVKGDCVVHCREGIGIRLNGDYVRYLPNDAEGKKKVCEYLHEIYEDRNSNSLMPIYLNRDISIREVKGVISKYITQRYLEKMSATILLDDILPNIDEVIKDNKFDELPPKKKTVTFQEWKDMCIQFSHSQGSYGRYLRRLDEMDKESLSELEEDFNFDMKRYNITTIVDAVIFFETN